MFMFGGVPALLVSFIRYGVHESARWEQQIAARRQRADDDRVVHGALFAEVRAADDPELAVSPDLHRRALGRVRPRADRQSRNSPLRAGYRAADAARLASYGTMVLSAGTILGCILLPPLAERFGRRTTMAMFFALMFLSISIGFGYVFYLPGNALQIFFVVLFFLGVGGANFAMYTLWLPEQYSTDCRGSAFAFTTSVGRFAGAGITFLVGAGVQYFGTLGTPVALTSIAFLIGLLLLPFGEETHGQTLPS